MLPLCDSRFELVTIFTAGSVSICVRGLTTSGISNRFTSLGRELHGDALAVDEGTSSFNHGLQLGSASVNLGQGRPLPENFNIRWYVF